MSLPFSLTGTLRLPVIGAPLFLISNPDLLIAQCEAGIVGSLPALNARPVSQLDEWLHRITTELASWNLAHPDAPAAPFAINQIVHKSNDRLEADLELCVKWKVPVVITSLGARADVYQAVRGYGGFTFHDVIHNSFAHKAIDKGADGLVLVTAGAGGHAGTLSPFALLQEVREWFDGPVALAGAISTGASVLGAIAAGADLAYMGSRFIATREANAPEAYKQMMIDSTSADVVYTNLFTGVHGNYLRGSILRSGLDPDALPKADPTVMNFASGAAAAVKAWRDIWGCGQGIGVIHDAPPAAAVVARLAGEFERARLAFESRRLARAAGRSPLQS